MTDRQAIRTQGSTDAHDHPTQDRQTDQLRVAIVGFGPTGATLAALLARRGCRVIVIEAAPRLNPDPRASYFDGDSLRVWQEIGVADEIAAAAIPLPGLHFRDAAGDLVLDWPMPASAGTSCWPASNLLHQPDLEAILRRRAVELGAEVHLGERVVALARGAVSATLLTETATGTRSVEADFVVGCDGGSSSVRSALAFDWEDFDCTLRWHLADVEITGPSALPEVTTAIMDPAGPRMVGHLARDRYRWLWLRDAGETESLPDPHTVLDSLTHGVGPHNARITRVATYLAHARVATRWVDERVMVAGDAAHLLPPLLGQGIGAGIRDAANLSWKLDAVRRASLPVEALDTYEAERRPHARAVVGLSAAISTYVFTRDPDLAAERDGRLRVGDIPLELIPGEVALGQSWLCPTAGTGRAGTELPQWRLADGTRTDDLLGAGFSMVMSPNLQDPEGLCARLQEAVMLDWAAWGQQVAHDAAVDRAAEGWLASCGLDAVLVRPDRIIAAALPTTVSPGSSGDRADVPSVATPADGASLADVGSPS